MQLLCYIAVTLLCGLSLSLSEATISCKDNQYLWPLEKPRVCCNKCPPGSVMSAKKCSSILFLFTVQVAGWPWNYLCISGTRLDRPNSNSTCSHTCKKCDGDMYQQTYNLDLTCNICENCRRSELFQIFPPTDCTIYMFLPVSPVCSDPGLVYNLVVNPFDGIFLLIYMTDLTASSANPVCSVVVPSGLSVCVRGSL